LILSKRGTPNRKTELGRTFKAKFMAPPAFTTRNRPAGGDGGIQLSL
jgi:hypothetical protein